MGRSPILRNRPIVLPLGSRYPLAIACISASPHLSGPHGAATLIRRTFIPDVSVGAIVPSACGAGKRKRTVAFGIDY